jgi:hypothetical protein
VNEEACVWVGGACKLKDGLHSCRQRGSLNVTVLEASARVGGRVYTERNAAPPLPWANSTGAEVDLGATWLHDSGATNPVTQIIQVGTSRLVAGRGSSRRQGSAALTVCGRAQVLGKADSLVTGMAYPTKLVRPATSGTSFTEVCGTPCIAGSADGVRDSAGLPQVPAWEVKRSLIAHRQVTAARLLTCRAQSGVAWM